MADLTPPAVPKALREMLRDYPGHIERLQEVLGQFAVPRPRVQPFEEAVWALQDSLEGFVHEAEAEQQLAESRGDTAAAELAKIKRSLMSRACSKHQWLDEDLWGYFQDNKEAFE